ncbi:UNVERIFIED_CONTAM: hypothetical protein NCL1_14121 [Trichonephila clavipes]
MLLFLGDPRKDLIRQSIRNCSYNKLLRTLHAKNLFYFDAKILTYPSCFKNMHLKCCAKTVLGS